METSFRAADWRPLQRALETEFGSAAAKATSAFWFIGFVAGPDDIGALRLYEHSATRRRLALDAFGNAYRRCAEWDRYTRALASDVLVQALV
ncbi:MAG: hypothetical protein ABIW79_10630 [Gemmatimonas sp.]